MVDKLRIAMIGGGPTSMIGPVHRVAIRLTNEYDLVAGCFSSKPEKRHEIAEALDMNVDVVYPDWQSLLKDAGKLKLDAVTILTLNDTHVEIATKFAEAGIHIICEKPLSNDWEGVKELQEVIKRNNLTFTLTHPYSAFPTARLLHKEVAEGKFGKIKMVDVEYIQGWLRELLETDAKNAFAVWREDPKVGGPGGVIGDIGVHALQLAEYISGLSVQSLNSDVTQMPGRKVPDDARMMLRLNDGATGSLWCSQVAVGCRNALNIRVFGEKGSFSWGQEDPETVHYFDANNIETVYKRGIKGDGYLPSGFTIGYCEAFSQLYDDAAKSIRAHKKGETYSHDSPGLDYGVRGLKFIDAVLKSSHDGGKWTEIQ